MALRSGPMWASADEIRLTIVGSGGHGATPHLTIDAVAVAAQVVSALQTIASRETPPTQPFVMTIGTIHGGTAFNIVADRVEMRGTVRALDEEVRRYALQRVEETASLVAAGMRATAGFQLVNSCPVLVNDPQVTAFVRDVAQEVVGPEQVIEVDRGMVADDMAHFLNRAPGCYFLVGAANPERGYGGPHHSPQFDLDESALPVAAEVLAAAALRYLGAV